jgi:hypothetical protein
MPCKLQKILMTINLSKKKPQISSRIFIFKIKIYALPAAAIKFNAEPATNQPI